MIIREAITTDFDQIVAMARTMRMESPRFSRVAFAPEKVYELAAGLTTSEDGVVFIAEDDEGVLLGLYAGLLVPYFFSHEYYASDLALYVKPEYRGSTLAVKLVQAFVVWATKKGVREIAPGVSTEVGTETVKMLYEALGFRVGGHLFLKDV